LGLIVTPSNVECHRLVKAEHICLEAAKNTTYDPLCASNGQTYQNLITYQCFVRYFEVYGLTARHGECEDNPQPDHCVLAFVIWRRVCGTDNVTYSSVWELMCEEQRLPRSDFFKDITVQYEGPCGVQCPMTLEYKPVCSSNNVDYPNIAALKCAAARKPHLDITYKSDGLCANKRLPSYVCQPNKKNMRNVPERPVCANNGVTYASYNALSCLRFYNQDLRILHDGPCAYEDVIIPDDSHKVCCLADNNAIMMPVCGTDNATYPNPFVLHCAMYRGVVSSEVKIQHGGGCEENMVDGEMSEQEVEDPCKTSDDDSPNKSSYKPLFCGSDGKTYHNTKEYACAVKLHSDWYHYTINKVGEACEPKDSPCEILRTMPEGLISDPICGSDGKSYANSLALMCAILSEPKLRKHHKGPCLPP
ncbi:hypothetical protein L9F63_021074, partial [Diploptera punctata]